MLVVMIRWTGSNCRRQWLCAFDRWSGLFELFQFGRVDRFEFFVPSVLTQKIGEIVIHSIVGGRFVVNFCGEC